MSSQSSYWLSSDLFHADERSMHFGVGNKTERVGGGLVFFGLGLIVCILVPATIGPEKMDLPKGISPDVAQALAAACGVVFMLVGWLVACVVDDLSLDFTTGKYLRRSGVWPLLRKRQGLQGEFSHLTLHSEVRDVHDREVNVWVAQLVWKDPVEKPMQLLESVDFSGHGDRRNRIMAKLADISDRLGLQIQEAPIRQSEQDPQGFLRQMRERLYGNPNMRVRDRAKAAAAFGLMTVGCLWVHLTANFQLGGAVAIAGYVVWAGVVLYVAGGLLWESIAPSDSGAAQSHLRAWVLVTLTLLAAGICLIGPLH